MSISFRQRRTITLAAATATQIMWEGDEGTFTNGCDTISVEISNPGANPITLIEVYVDGPGYGTLYVLNTTATTALGTVAAGATKYATFPSAFKRFKVIATSALGTVGAIFQICGVNAQ